MKKFTKTLLVALLGLTVTACGNTNNSSSTNSSTSTSSSTSNPIDAVLEEIAARIVVVKNNQEVADDFEVPSVVTLNYEGEEISINISWSADKENVTFETVDGVTWARLTRPEFGGESVLVKLTASFEYEGKTGTKGFKVTVLPESGLADLWGERTDIEISTWAEWRAATSGKIAVQGIVTAWTWDEGYSNGNVFLQDEDGGYYAYAVPASKSEFEKYLAVGNEVIIEGTKTIYSGFHEFNSKSVTAIEVVSRDNGRPAPIDVTQASKDGTLDNYQSVWTTVLGTYTVGSDGYKYIQVGGNKYQIYHNDKYNQETFDEVTDALATFAEGDTIRLTGLVGCYTNPQFHPYTAVKSDEVVTITDEEKVAMAKNEVFANFETKYQETTEVELYTSEDVTIEYSLNAEADTSVFALNTETNKLTITPTVEGATATLSAKITSGTATETVTIDLTAALPETDVDSYVLTVDSLGLTSQSYSAGTKSVNGVEFEYVELGNYGNGIQMRNKTNSGGNVSELWNNEATNRPIKEINLTYNSENSTYDNADAFTFKFGTDTEVSAYETTLSTVKDTTTYTVTPDAETYTHFYMTLNLTYSFYWDSIEIVLAEPTSQTMVSDGSKDYVPAGDTTDYAERLGLNSELFSVTFETNDCTNASGIARFHDTNGIQIYGSNYQADPVTDQGAALVLTIKQPEGKTLTITTVVVNVSGTKGYSVGSSEIITATGETTFDVNSTEGFKVQSRSTSQTKVMSIVINYTIA